MAGWFRLLRSIIFLIRPAESYPFVPDYEVRQARSSVNAEVAEPNVSLIIAG